MATIQFPRKGVGALAAAPIAGARVIDIVVDLANDVTMANATDDIVVADLPAGTVVIAAGIEQIVAGEADQGTLAPRVGATAAEVQEPRVGGGTLGTGPIVAVVATVAQRTAVVVPVTGGREHQVAAKKIGSTVIDRITGP